MEELHDSVDLAMEESFHANIQDGIRFLAKWSVSACWTGDEGNTAYLICRGKPGERSDSARLRVFERSQDSPAWLLTTFDMDFTLERLNTYQTIVDKVGIREVLRVERAQRRERKVGLSGMTEEQAHMLFAELEYGVSGRYVRAR